MGKIIFVIGCVIFGMLLMGCSTNAPQVIVITSTSEPVNNISADSNLTIPTQIISPTFTPLPTQIISDNPNSNEYVVQAGDTLSQIAERHSVPLQSLISLNQITDPNLLEFGQVLLLPAPPTTYTSNMIILPDSRLVRSTDSIGFDIDSFVSTTSGYLKSATDTVETRLADGSIRRDILPATDVVERVAIEYSVDERLLLSFLEYRARWLSNNNLTENQINFPLISAENSLGFGRKGLYKQLSWLANELNRGYYRAKFGTFDTLTFQNGTQLLVNHSINPGTLALQYVLSLNNTVDMWDFDVSESGLQDSYRNLFGLDSESLSNPNLGLPPVQPLLSLPFRKGDIWRFTGGFHGGWGSGSAWSALDFAPPDDRQDGDPFCYISEYPVTAVADGVISRINNGSLILDLDGDADERTGWSILYLHITVNPAIGVGQQVTAGTSLGNASCFGGFSTATHLHIARRYNGEWIPADCDSCDNVAPFIMSNWQAVGLIGQEYQGFMLNLGTNQRVVAEQGRNVEINAISW